ncbi:Npun_F5749 family FMN-dependent PPOX-type flavoprotein [Baaleninema sp.]|uniref:Npun_F5749 family FMN-dependent PPOX-type flavoprotein n=1 Tax=Baaleninema sp. TaxID=3101197 RepID=UPI003CFEE953
MKLAPWRTHISGALHRNRSLIYSRYFQLATVRRNGTPANRTVVFRGFETHSDRLQIVTDSRSEKIEQLQHNTNVEACWYFPKTRVQFRFQGTIEIVDSEGSDEALNAARRQVWETLSDAARSGFAWPKPGAERSPSEAFEVDPPNPEIPLDSFCLLLLDPCRVEFLALRGEPQNRWIYDRQPNGTWTEREVNP